jgi:HemY protein
MFIFGIINTLLNLPDTLRRYKARRRKEKGYRALTLGLAAVAAGDAKIAALQAARAEKYMPEDTGLPMLLKAQSQRLLGEEDDARQSFLRMLENKDAAFLGVRGLLQAALDAQNYNKALDLARQAQAMHPKQPWILRTVYDLEIRRHEWNAARTTLKKIRKQDDSAQIRADSDEVALLLAESDQKFESGDRDKAIALLKQAHAIDAAFAPTVQRLARFYNDTTRRSACIALIEKAWKLAPHPSFVALWEQLATAKEKDPVKRLRWFERLYKLNPDDPESLMMMARATMEEGIWGEAREYLHRAQELGADARLYKIWAELENRAGHNKDAAARMLNLALEARPAKVWICRVSGRIYKDWAPIATPHGSFNTIVWDDPDTSVSSTMIAKDVTMPLLAG